MAEFHGTMLSSVFDDTWFHAGWPVGDEHPDEHDIILLPHAVGDNSPFAVWGMPVRPEVATRYSPGTLQ